MALTLDGFLPHEDEMLMRWVRENKRYGFPRWQRQATFHIYPHYGLMDLLNVKEKHDKDCIYLAGVGDGGSAEYADGLFRYNVIVKTCSDICFTIGQKLSDVCCEVTQVSSSSQPNEILSCSFGFIIS